MDKCREREEFRVFYGEVKVEEVLQNLPEGMELVGQEVGS